MCVCSKCLSLKSVERKIPVSIDPKSNNLYIYIYIYIYIYVCVCVCVCACI